MPSNSDDRGGQLAVPEYHSALQPAAAGYAVQPAPRAAGPPARRDAGRVLRLIALIAVAAGLAALTAAACVLSYAPMHHLAVAAGVSPRLARLYPLIFDALLVIAGCSVLALRGAGLVSRIYSWFCLIVLLAALAGGGAVRAAAVTVPRKLAGVVAAVVPWALVLIGFGLLLALLRYARMRRVTAAQDEAGGEPEPSAGPDAGAAAHADVVVVEDAVDERPRATRPGLVPGLGGTAGHGGLPETAPQPTPPGAAQRPPVRQADMQLRARIPRQPAEQAAAGPAGAAQPASGSAGSEQAGTGSAGAGSAGSGPAGAEQAGTGSAGAGSAGSGPAGAGAAGSGQAGTGSAGTGSAGSGQASAGDTAAARQAPLMPPGGPTPVAEATELREQANPRSGGPPGDMSAAPTLAPEADDESGERPALRRQHSSPTPPDED